MAPAAQKADSGRPVPVGAEEHVQHDAIACLDTDRLRGIPEWQVCTVVRVGAGSPAVLRVMQLSASDACRQMLPLLVSISMAT